MSRAFLIVLDSVGLGGAPDAAAFFNDGRPDTGANTLAHIAQACATGGANAGRSGPLHMPNLDALGLGAAIALTTGSAPDLGARGAAPAGLFGVAQEVSNGKDTPSGHWELAGVPVPFDWGYFPKEDPAFSPELQARVAQLCGAGGTLGNCHASGTNIIESLAEEHMRCGWPICYTSVDSVFQIAAHEETFGLARLLTLCEDLAPELHARNIGRVIARPFVGDAQRGFKRTANRHDYAMMPPSPTLCDWVHGAGRAVHAIGKIGDIFSMQGIDDCVKGSDAQLFDHLVQAARTAQDGALVFANFVEFDSLYGHRRDVSGYARHLEWFDAALPRLFQHARPDDLFLFTADHGNDPTWHGTDHTRERVPVLGFGVGAQAVGPVAFVDIAASIAAHLNVPAQGNGRSFLSAPSPENAK
ncbi:Phosphopentomutase [Aquimixticola soesokkakensis]|uniref:Phosphopentomutase n=1 Tax=Aquimixticola soesokkakensis TaxID=1519096 RepID=A0A1Y5TQJ8_9RHOB|nr:phosphopentomutase [Aquimixticola soesokkakensis]SLN67417.1 Phosphopentomutase [Aquimixticola soesokkakensis]